MMDRLHNPPKFAERIFSEKITRQATGKDTPGSRPKAKSGKLTIMVGKEICFARVATYTHNMVGMETYPEDHHSKVSIKVEENTMPTCFMIQPFDAGKFDKRFEDVYKPAIIAAGLEPYRVDFDPKVEIPIDSIEEGIKSASICLADITTDNPNVWYELGYSFASRRPVVMVCSNERTSSKYPFDIQHRTVINYKAESKSDFDMLQIKVI